MDKQTLIENLTLVLLDLCSWTEGEGDFAYRRAWKGMDFDALDALAEDGYIVNKYRNKSIAITDKGIAHARELAEELGLVTEPEPQEQVQRFFRFVLRFRDFEPMVCTRTLLVPEHTSFEDFHTMIQACLNWLNYHLYDFRLKSGGKDLRISWPDFDTGGDPQSDFYAPGANGEWRDSSEIYLDDVFPKTKKALYSYDYGDGWEIEIEMINPHEKIESSVPICWEGAGDAPPEDVGGPGGFAYFIEMIGDESHPEYEHFVAWGEDQGFEQFSKRKANKRLAHWQDWAIKSEKQEPEASETGGKADISVVYTRSEAKEVDADEDYEAQVKKILEANGRCLQTFDEWLTASGLSDKTINNHLDNVSFYLNTYLNYYEPTPMERGVSMLDGYLGDWFIRKCMWSTPASIKSTAASIKKFYKCMSEKGLVTKKDYDFLCADIKENVSEWQEACEDWDSGGSLDWF